MNIKTPLSGRPNLYTKTVAKGAFHRKWCPLIHDAEIKMVGDADSGEYKLRAKASTMSIDRDGEIVLPSAFLLDDYEKNPMFLWNHRWYGNIEDSLGCVEDLVKTDDALLATFCYDAEFCERTLKLWNKVTKSRSIRGYSVGFRMLEWVTAHDDEEKINSLPPFAAQALRRGDVWLVHTKVALFEISQVLIPSCIDALAEVDELAALAAAPDTQKQTTERTDEMELSKLVSQLEDVQKSVGSIVTNQETLASAVKSATEANIQLVKEMSQLKADQAKAAETPPETKDPFEGVKSLEDLPEALRKSIVDEVLEAIS